MKKLLKISFKIILFFVFALFTSCEKELYEEAIVSSQKNRNIIATTKTFKELNSNFEFNSAYNKISSKLKTKGINNKLLYDVNVDTSKVNVVFLDKYSSYSFKIIEVENGQDYYKNLLIEIDSLDRVSAKILRYNEDIEKRIASINEIIVIPKIEEEVSSSESAAKCEWIEVTTQTQCSGQEHHWPGEPDCVPQDATSHTTLYLNCGGSDVSYVPNFPTISVPSQQQNGASISYPVSNSNELKMRRFLNSLKLDQREFFTSLPIASQDAIYLHLIATNFLTSGRVKSFILNMISNNLDSYFYGNLSDSSANIGLEQSVNNIITYLIQNSFNQQSTGFVNAFIIQSIINPTLNLDFITSFKSPANIDRSTISNDTPEGAKFNTIYDKLADIQQFKDFFINIFQDNNRFNVKFEIGDIPNINGQFINAETTPSGNNFIIKINSQILTSQGTHPSTNIEIAKTILHECIHAYLHVIAQNNTINIDNMNVSEALNAIYTTGTAQHNFMIQHMIPSMETIVTQLLNSLTTAEQRNNCELFGEPQPWIWSKFIHFLCLNGLQETSEFNEQLQPLYDSNGVMIDGNSEGQLYIQYIVTGNLFLLNP